MGASVERVPGVVSADLNFASATLLVITDGTSGVSDEVTRVVVSTGHGITPLVEGAPSSDDGRSWIEAHRADIAAVGGGIFTAAGFVAERFAPSPVAAIALFAIAIAFGGQLVWRRALVSLRARILDMNALMSVAVLGAATLGEWGEGATVFFLFALGGLLEARSLDRTRRSIRDLMSFAPQMARVERGDETSMVPVADVHVGERVFVRPGERIPVDGEVVQGASSVDESPITGESVPVDRTVGEMVFAGSMNVTGALHVECRSEAQDSTLSRIVHLVEEAQASRAPSQTFVERFSRVYTPVVIALAMAFATVPPLVAMLLGSADPEWSEWIERALVMLVVSCPCALVVSTPVSIVSAITRASRDGVLVKGGVFLERASSIRVVALDKTGTITQGRPAARAVHAVHGRSDGDVIRIAASVEAHSNHPVARAVVAAAEAAGIAIADATDVVEMPGRGVVGRAGDARVSVLAPHAAGVSAALGPRESAWVDDAERRGMTALVVFEDDVVVGVIGVADEVRAGASAALQALRRQGIAHVVMLTGDNDRAAQAVAHEAGVSEVRARLLPQDKTAAIESLRRAYGPVLMVGDGINDAPALASADIGVSMGAAGSDVALETADVALMSDDLEQVARFLRLGTRTLDTIRINIAFSVAVKVVFLALASVGAATLWMAVFADTGVTLLVILNGMRLLRRA